MENNKIKNNKIKDNKIKDNNINQHNDMNWNQNINENINQNINQNINEINVFVFGLLFVGKSTFLTTMLNGQNTESLFLDGVLFNRASIVLYDKTINIYDCDSNSNHLDNKWICQNTHLIDIIIFITDLNKGLDLVGIELLENILAVSKNKFKIICLLNKCDDIYYDNNKNNDRNNDKNSYGMIFGEKDQENIYLDANNKLTILAKKYNLAVSQNNDDLSNNIDTTMFLPITLENYHIYQLLINNSKQPLDPIYQNRLGKNECGQSVWKYMKSDEKQCMLRKIIGQFKIKSNQKILDTGYENFNMIFQKIISCYKNKFMINHIIYEIIKLDTEYEIAKLDKPIAPKAKKTFSSLQENLSGHICQEATTYNFCDIYTDLVLKYDSLLSETDTIGRKELWTNIKNHITQWVRTIQEIPTTIINRKNFIELPKFDQIHQSIQKFYNMLDNFSNSVKNISGYNDNNDNDFFDKAIFDKATNVIISKIISIYDQICQVRWVDQIHCSPIYLALYLQTVEKYCPVKYEFYATQFLTTVSKSAHIINSIDLPNLIVQIIDTYNKYNFQINPLLSTIINVFINKQLYIKKTFPKIFLIYAIQVKKQLKQHIFTEFNPLDVWYEVTNQNIQSVVKSKGLSSIRSDINLDMVQLVLDKFAGSSASQYGAHIDNAVFDIRVEQTVLRTLF